MKPIIQKYLEGVATEPEQQELLSWLRKKENQSLFRKYKSDWRASLEEENRIENNQESWKQLQNKLFRKSYEGWQRTFRLLSVYKYAAVLFFLVSISSILALVFKKPVAPREIVSTVVADNGQISKIILPDSSLVWLNSGTTLSYSNRFALENRNIQLDGEAWFQARKNEALPMVVNCSGLFVKVLGTSFNVSAYKGFGKIDVVLERGLVELYRDPGKAPVCQVKPGELAEYDRLQGTVAVSKVNTAKYKSWKEGMINFYNLRLDEVVLRLEKRYNQQFIIDEQIRAIPLTFTIKNESLEAVLNLMARIAPVSAIQEKELIQLRYGKISGRKEDKR